MTTNLDGYVGHVVIGPPGSGKTTYCRAMSEFMRSKGRTVKVINLDPANDNIPYECGLSISELITVEDIMERFGLGPNGALSYAMEFLEDNLDWLVKYISTLESKTWLIFDFPGQMELYTHHDSVKNITEKLQKLGLRLAAVNLVDSHYCNEPGKFISVLLASLSSMVQLALPHLNILSKFDLIKKSKLNFHPDFYMEVLDLEYLVQCLDDDPIMSRYKKLNSLLASVVEEYSLVSFLPLNVQDKKKLKVIMINVDKCLGFLSSSSNHSKDNDNEEEESK